MIRINFAERQSKVCTKCGIDKSFGDYGNHGTGKFGLRPDCKECRAVVSRAWRDANLETVRANSRDYARAHSDVNTARSRQWYADNKERARDTARAYNEANPGLSAKYQREYRKRYPAKVKAAWKKRRAQKRDATIIEFTAEQLDQRMSVFGHACAYCGGPFQEVDHVIPISKGGAHCLANLRPACTPCNRSKWARTPDEWRRLGKYRAA